MLKRMATNSLEDESQTDIEVEFKPKNERKKESPTSRRRQRNRARARQHIDLDFSLIFRLAPIAFIVQRDHWMTRTTLHLTQTSNHDKSEGLFFSWKNDPTLTTEQSTWTGRIVTKNSKACRALCGWRLVGRELCRRVPAVSGKKARLGGQDW